MPLEVSLHMVTLETAQHTGHPTVFLILPCFMTLTLFVGHNTVPMQILFYNYGSNVGMIMRSIHSCQWSSFWWSANGLSSVMWYFETKFSVRFTWNSILEMQPPFIFFCKVNVNSNNRYQSNGRSSSDSIFLVFSLCCNSLSSKHHWNLLLPSQNYNQWLLWVSPCLVVEP
jgi:hypothetical protein